MHRRFILLTAVWLGVAGSGAAQTAPATGDQRREYLFAATGQAMRAQVCGTGRSVKGGCASNVPVMRTVVVCSGASWPGSASGLVCLWAGV